MTILIAIDDTDNLESRGTGRLARAIADTLAKEYPVYGITRHQLYVHPDIPYTSHNSCAVIHLETNGHADIDGIFATAERVMLADFVTGSDPGLAVARVEEISAPLIAFGRDAKISIQTQTKARALAKNLGIRLKGLGGTEDGVIGAMAGLGLAVNLNDGRFLQRGKIRDVVGPATVEQLHAAAGEHLHISLPKDSEVFPSDGIFVAAAQEANVIGIFQVFEARRVTPGFLHIPLDRPRRPGCANTWSAKSRRWA